MSREEKAQSHARIIEHAARLLRERGIEGTSVADVMQAAGLTHGGFYKHFPNKEALIEASLRFALEPFARSLDAPDPDKAVTAYRKTYLSEGHRDNPGIGCPMAAIGTEVARAAEGVKKSMTDGIRRIVAGVSRAMPGSGAARRRAALRELSMLVGAIVIARASDETLSAEVLRACRED